MDSVVIDATDTNSPIFTAFSGSEIAKTAALHYFAEKLKDQRYASITIKTLNSSTSVKGGISNILRFMANDQDGNGCSSWPKI
ncbi:MAG: hypothetical protein H6973_17970 [Gammaproteobacteria bacterium]|nr:hypothetical protein [Gammaproteobacteria bacterium]